MAIRCRNYTETEYYYLSNEEYQALTEPEHSQLAETFQVDDDDYYKGSNEQDTIARWVGIGSDIGGCNCEDRPCCGCN